MTRSLRLSAARRRGGVVTQRPAKPFTPVRFRSSPCPRHGRACPHTRVPRRRAVPWRPHARGLPGRSPTVEILCAPAAKRGRRSSSSAHTELLCPGRQSSSAPASGVGRLLVVPSERRRLGQWDGRTSAHQERGHVDPQTAWSRAIAGSRRAEPIAATPSVSARRVTRGLVVTARPGRRGGLRAAACLRRSGRSGPNGLGARRAAVLGFRTCRCGRIVRGGRRRRPGGDRSDGA